MSAEVQDLAVRYGAAWADRDVDAIVAMHTVDTVYHLHGAGSLPLVSRLRARRLQRRLRSGPTSALSARRSISGSGTS